MAPKWLVGMVHIILLPPFISILSISLGWLVLYRLRSSPGHQGFRHLVKKSLTPNEHIQSNPSCNTWPDKNATDPTKQRPACDHERDQATKYPTSPPNWATQLPHAETTILSKECTARYTTILESLSGSKMRSPCSYLFLLMGHRASFLAKPKSRWFLRCQQNTIRCACVLEAGSKAAIKP